MIMDVSRTCRLGVVAVLGLALAGATCSTPSASAAELQLPRPSQRGELSQTVGLTKISLVYSRPGVKGRKIWGDLVPYDKVWRTGANEATAITFSTDVRIGGQALPAGSYSLHTIPTTGEWTVIFNKSADLWGSYDYKEANDALRVRVKPVPHEATEWLEFSFPAVSNEKATLALDWEKVRVPVEIEVDTINIALKNAREAMTALAADDFRTAFRCADFAFQNGVAPEEAAAWVDRSIAIKPMWLNLRLKANMLAKSGKYAEASDVARKAIDAGKTDAPPDELTKIEKLIAEWQAKKS